ncbi:hypothetical protein PF005_g2513 [Phytophthora fragariae]|uniref:Uncharacterized protein n=1 Tax=Phytophthora fragariae TaxID=53985 RepID=A0A6A3TEK0_9STRA|nr:hypothetical protein PF003_g8274 [Phytophthora fragariae]KAE8940595.1 hypothetical protein PF009_g9597 [Phytophthora fragariae]KAE9015354.1 hypothetical protein PF011_g7654 [Phytophthora fragariae]KAE9118876.1 hypothetical protein PF010_g8061 [Phytophthora fragariae]KAE9132615.1 hypothetical protein PF006_g15238 [Phytophthora fragariae]
MFLPSVPPNSPSVLLAMLIHPGLRQANGRTVPARLTLEQGTGRISRPNTKAGITLF